MTESPRRREYQPESNFKRGDVVGVLDVPDDRTEKYQTDK